MKVIFVLALALLGVIVHSALGGIADNDYYEYDYQDDYIDYDSMDDTQGEAIVEDNVDTIDEHEKKPLVTSDDQLSDPRDTQIEKNIIDAENDVEYQYDDDLEMEQNAELQMK